MGKRLGIIAGSGEFPFLAAEDAGKKGYTCFVAGLTGETNPRFSEIPAHMEWFSLSELDGLISYFKRNKVSDVIWAGKIRPDWLYKTGGREGVPPAFRIKLEEAAPSRILESAVEFLAVQGIRILDPTPFLTAHFCPPGAMTAAGVSASVAENADYGWAIARSLADLDIGQVVIVKNKSVIAVEGVEGTDAAIERAGRLAGPGTVAVKVSRTRQDPRIDVPAVGLDTVRALAAAGSAAMCLEAGKVAFFQKAESIALADSRGICLWGR